MYFWKESILIYTLYEEARNLDDRSHLGGSYFHPLARDGNFPLERYLESENVHLFTNIRHKSLKDFHVQSLVDNFDNFLCKCENESDPDESLVECWDIDRLINLINYKPFKWCSNVMLHCKYETESNPDESLVEC